MLVLLAPINHLSSLLCSIRLGCWTQNFNLPARNDNIWDLTCTAIWPRHPPSQMIYADFDTRVFCHFMLPPCTVFQKTRDAPKCRPFGSCLSSLICFQLWDGFTLSVDLLVAAGNFRPNLNDCPDVITQTQGKRRGKHLLPQRFLKENILHPKKASKYYSLCFRLADELTFCKEEIHFDIR